MNSVNFGTPVMDLGLLGICFVIYCSNWKTIHNRLNSIEVIPKASRHVATSE